VFKKTNNNDGGGYRGKIKKKTVDFGGYYVGGVSTTGVVLIYVCVPAKRRQDSSSVGPTHTRRRWVRVRGDDVTEPSAVAERRFSSRDRKLYDIRVAATDIRKRSDTRRVCDCCGQVYVFCLYVIIIMMMIIIIVIMFEQLFCFKK